MAEPEMNVQQLYERLYGDMESKSKWWFNSSSYNQMRNALRELTAAMNRLNTPGRDGQLPVLTEKDLKKLQFLTGKTAKAAREYAAGHNIEDRSSEVGRVRAVAAENLKNLALLDMNRLNDLKFVPGLTLRQTMGHYRSIQEEHDLSALEKTGGALSARIKLGETEHHGRGFFTVDNNAEYRAESRQALLNRIKEKYPRKAAVLGALFTGNYRIDHRLMQYVLGERTENREFLRLPEGVTLDALTADEELRRAVRELWEQERELGGRLDVFNATGILGGRNLNRRNVAMSRVAAMLGRGSLLARSETMIIRDGGREVSGTFMEYAQGKDKRNMANEELFFDARLETDSREARLDLASLAVLDYICGNTDRHGGNMFYKLEDGPDGPRLTGIVGIDNDNSFGIHSGEYYAEGAGAMNSVGLDDLGVIRREDARRVAELTREDLEYRLHDLLEPDEIEAAWERTRELQQAIARARNLPGQDTIMEEGTLYLATDNQLSTLDLYSFHEKHPLHKPLSLQRSINLMKTGLRQMDWPRKLRDAVEECRKEEPQLDEKEIAQRIHANLDDSLKEPGDDWFSTITKPSKGAEGARQLREVPGAMQKKAFQNIQRLTDMINSRDDLSTDDRLTHQYGAVLGFLAERAEEDFSERTMEEEKILKAAKNTGNMLQTVLESAQLRHQLTNPGKAKELLTAAPEETALKALRGPMICQLQKKTGGLRKQSSKAPAPLSEILSGENGRAQLDDLCKKTPEYRQLVTAGTNEKAVYEVSRMACTKKWLSGVVDAIGKFLSGLFKPSAQQNKGAEKQGAGKQPVPAPSSMPSRETWTGRSPRR